MYFHRTLSRKKLFKKTSFYNNATSVTLRADCEVLRPQNTQIGPEYCGARYKESFKPKISIMRAPPVNTKLY